MSLCLAVIHINCSQAPFQKCKDSSLLCDCESCSHKVRRKQSSTCQVTMCLTWRQEDSDKSAFNIHSAQTAKYEDIASLYACMLQSSMMDLLLASEWLPSNVNISAAFMHSWTRNISRRLLWNETPGEQQSFLTCADLIHTDLHFWGGGGCWEKAREMLRESVGTWGWMSIG